MNVARDFSDDATEFGAASVRAALDAACWPAAPNEGGEKPLRFEATPFRFRESSSIPRRDFLYGFELRRKQGSAVISPGATGKTTFKVGRAICIATGREYLGHRVWNGPHRVWLWNLEDEMEEVEKTVHAFLKLWHLTPADLGDRLFIDGVDSPCTSELKLGVGDKSGGYSIRKPVADAVVDSIRARGIDYLDVDPFVSSHSVNENDNGAIDAVTKEWVGIAHRSNAAVSLTHHVRKPNGSEASAFDARGAVAMINAARSVLVLQKMTKETAQEFQIPECDRRLYLSVYDDKNNKAPPPARAEWFKFESVGLGNADDTGPEDSVGALIRWEAPNAFGGVTARQLLHIQEIIQRKPEEARKHSASPHWVGKIVAHVLDRNLDAPGDKQNVKRMVDTWCANGALRTITRQNTKRETVEYVEVGQLAVVE